jgi:hypothetical protein
MRQFARRPWCTSCASTWESASSLLRTSFHIRTPLVFHRPLRNYGIMSFSTDSSVSSETRQLLGGLIKGDRVSLSRAITLSKRVTKFGQITAFDCALSTPVESSRLDHRQQASFVLDSLLKARYQSGGPSGLTGLQASDGLTPAGTAQPATPTQLPTFRIGVAGPPGAGKSSLIEALGCHVLNTSKHRLAVLAVDPSSRCVVQRLTWVSRQHRRVRLGATCELQSVVDCVPSVILSLPNAYPPTMIRYIQPLWRLHFGRSEGAFVRPSPTRGTLGGLAEHTNEVPCSVVDRTLT